MNAFENLFLSVYSERVNESRRWSEFRQLKRIRKEKKTSSVYNCVYLELCVVCKVAFVSFTYWIFNLKKKKTRNIEKLIELWIKIVILWIKTRQNSSKPESTFVFMQGYKSENADKSSEWIESVANRHLRPIVSIKIIVEQNVTRVHVVLRFQNVCTFIRSGICDVWLYAIGFIYTSSISC